LYVYLLKAEFVERNDAVYTAVPSAAHALQVGPTRPISHAMKNVEYYCLEEGR
jgi:hypothetical protein